MVGTTRAPSSSFPGEYLATLQPKLPTTVQSVDQSLAFLVLWIVVRLTVCWKPSFQNLVAKLLTFSSGGNTSRADLVPLLQWILSGKSDGSSAF